LAIKISIPWFIGLNQAHAFTEKVHQVKLKYGNNHLAKIGAKDGSGYITASSTAI